MSKTTEAPKQEQDVFDQATANAISTNVLFEQDAGAGTENIGKDELSIPYISLLQKTSQAVDPTSPGYVKGATIGQFLITGTNRLFNQLKVIPVHYKRQFAKYEDNDFRGYVDGDVVEKGIEAGTYQLAGRKIFDDAGFEYKDTRTHLFLVLDENNEPVTAAILNLSSTQIKKSKILLTEMQTFLETGASGKKFTPPTYSHVYTIHQVAEKNDNGSWCGVRFERVGFVQSSEVYNKAKAIHDSAQ